MDFEQSYQMLTDLNNQNNIWSAEQAQKQMDFQERMSNTAHQREMEDLKAAGLNPVLSAKLGGASTPNGASAESNGSIITALASLLSQSMANTGAAIGASGYGYGVSGYAKGSYGGKALSDMARAFYKGYSGEEVEDSLFRAGQRLGKAMDRIDEALASKQTKNIIEVNNPRNHDENKVDVRDWQVAAALGGLTGLVIPPYFSGGNFNILPAYVK